MLVADDEALDAAAAAAACGSAAVQPPQEGPPPLLVARQAAMGLVPSQEQQHDRQHSGEHTSTSVGVFELIDKSVRDCLMHCMYIISGAHGRACTVFSVVSIVTIYADVYCKREKHYMARTSVDRGIPA